MSEYVLRLFINGNSAHSARATASLKSICEHELHGRYRLEIIDIIDDPGAANDARIIATPTLMKMLPPPLRRVIGDLSDKQQVLFALDVAPSSPPGVT